VEKKKSKSKRKTGENGKEKKKGLKERKQGGGLGDRGLSVSFKPYGGKE